MTEEFLFATSINQRKAGAFTLAEMVVAVGLSGFFVLTLAGLLGQTLGVTTNIQKQLYAVAIAELAIENARNTPFNVLQSYSSKGTQVLNLYSENSGGSVPRLLPIQFDLSKNDVVYGAVNPLLGGFNADNRWTPNTGNFFRGRLEETISNADAAMSLNSLRIDVSVFYDAGEKQTRKLSRSILVFEND